VDQPVGIDLALDLENWANITKQQLTFQNGHSPTT
jgi:hypothetical protein